MEFEFGCAEAFWGVLGGLLPASCGFLAFSEAFSASGSLLRVSWALLQLSGFFWGFLRFWQPPARFLGSPAAF